MKIERKLKTFLGVATLLIVSSAANADFINGDFENGLTGWTITPTGNGTTTTQDTFLFDIDGGGPLGDSMAGRFGVGQVIFDFGVFEGIELTQSTSLSTGSLISVDVAAWNTGGDNADGGMFELIVNGTVLTSFNVGAIDAGEQISASLSVVYGGPSGTFAVGLRITRPWQVPIGLFQLVDNFVVPTPGVFALLGLGGMFSTRRRRR